MQIVQFMEQQTAVTIKTFESKNFIYLCLNERQVETEQGEKAYEYDFNEIHAPVGKIDLDRVQESPEEYLNVDYDALVLERETLKAKLASTNGELGDWKMRKYSEVVASGGQPPFDIQEFHEKSEAVRARINEIISLIGDETY